MGYPSLIVPVDHVEPVPRRVRAVMAGETVLDTIRALYVWEWPPYPQFYIPLADIRDGVLVDEDRTEVTTRGEAVVHGLRVGDTYRPGAAKVFELSPVAGVAGTARLEWRSLDAWYEEDEQVFVHPRSPYSRVDAIRSTRRVRVELDGAVLAESSSSVMVFETGLPTRYYFNRTEVDFTHLAPTETVTACPYKGITSEYWSARSGTPDLAWSYEFPTRQLLPIAGLIAFYNERVDISIDGQPQERPRTHFS